MAEAALKRFWTTAAPQETPDGWQVHLDGKPLRTPKRALLQVPVAELAAAIASEWQDAGAQIRPTDLPLTGIANAAIDVVAAARAEVEASLAAYADADLLCYRADSPAELLRQQELLWEPPLLAIEARHNVRFRRATGIVHVAQAPETLAAMRAALAALSDFQLSALQILVTISGSLVLPLAQLTGVLPAAAALRAATVDEDWQQQHWGTDAEAQAQAEARRRDYLAASRFLALLQI